MYRSNEDTIILTESVMVSVNSTTKEYYEEIFGRVLKVGEKIEVAVEHLTPSSNKQITVQCPICLETRVVRKLNITAYGGHTKCKRCVQKSKYEHLIGTKVGRLLIIGFGEDYNNCNGHGESTFDCICDCGNTFNARCRSIKDGDTRSCGCFLIEVSKENGRKQFGGKNNPKYNPELSDEERGKKRNSKLISIWRTAIFERDNYTCQCCGKVGGSLAAHHIFSYARYKELRHDTSNGITLCKNCHRKFHNLFLPNQHIVCNKTDVIRFLVWQNTRQHFWATTPEYGW